MTAATRSQGAGHGDGHRFLTLEQVVKLLLITGQIKVAALG